MPTPSPLTEDDYLSFEAAVELRESKPPKVRDQRALASLLKQKNFVRWRRMNSDMRWAMRVARKHGFNPEEVRYLFNTKH